MGLRPDHPGGARAQLADRAATRAAVRPAPVESLSLAPAAAGGVGARHADRLRALQGRLPPERRAAGDRRGRRAQRRRGRLRLAGPARSRRARSSSRSPRASTCRRWPSRTRCRPTSARRSRTTTTATSSSCTPRATSTTARRSSSARSTSSPAPGYVIVVRHGAASELHSARERLEQKPELLAARSDGRRVGDHGQGRRRLPAGHRGPRERRRGGRGGRLRGSRRRDEAHLLPAPRAGRVLPRRAPAADGARHARRPLARERPQAAAQPPARRRGPRPPRRGGDRARSATCWGTSSRPTSPSSGCSRTRSCARSPAGRRSSPCRRSWRASGA